MKYTRAATATRTNARGDLAWGPLLVLAGTVVAEVVALVPVVEVLVAVVVELEPAVVVRWVVLDDDEDEVDEVEDDDEEEEVVAVVEDEAAADELVLEETAVEIAVEALAEAEPVPVSAKSLL